MNTHGNQHAARADAENGEPLSMRLWAAFIAVPIFELALLLGIHAATGRQHGWLSWAVFAAVPAWLHLIYLALAVGLGLWQGFAGITWLMGHLFMTHFEQDRRPLLTALLWAGLLAASGLSYWMAG